MDAALSGQWSGESGQGAHIVLNVESTNGAFVGRSSIYEPLELDGDTKYYWSWAKVTGTINEGLEFNGEAVITQIHNQDGEFVSNEELKLINSHGIQFPLTTLIKGKVNSPCKLQVEWTSTYPSIASNTDSAILSKAVLTTSSVTPNQMSWVEYRNFALTKGGGFIFRGQANDWALQTSFHRTGSADIEAYLNNRVPELENHINSISPHAYNCKDDNSLGALLNLAQHHGYPTPLLDWTKSPYVAAFFAFADSSSLEQDGYVTVFIFDNNRWSNLSSTFAPLRVPQYVLRTLELPVFGNPRVLPQQAVTMYSNAADIELVLRELGTIHGPFLSAVSIPVSDRDIAMRDLSLMGITWGSMFPGLDGVCRQLASRHFGP